MAAVEHRHAVRKDDKDVQRVLRKPVVRKAVCSGFAVLSDEIGGCLQPRIGAISRLFPSLDLVWIAGYAQFLSVAVRYSRARGFSCDPCWRLGSWADAGGYD